MRARVHRIPAAGPDDVSLLQAAIKAGGIDPGAIVAILGKTEGNGCVNDFTRGYATASLKAGLSAWTVPDDIVFVMSGGTEGGLSPHWLVFEAIPDEHARATDATAKALAFGAATTATFAPHEIGRWPQIGATAEAVRAAMARAAITTPDDVHYVQVKCPLLTKARIAEAHVAGHTVATEDTYKSMAVSRGASALGVAIALGEIDAARVTDDAVCRDLSLFSTRASTSSGVELTENQILVVGNSAAWSGDLCVAHGAMRDSIDAAALAEALAGVGIQAGLPVSANDGARIVAVLAKAEASRSGLIRGARHTMLDDSDIQASRHARALVGGVLAAVSGTTMMFVSGGAEHQGPDGGGPVAVIARRKVLP
jgi:cyanuric acid amidohydrolase